MSDNMSFIRSMETALVTKLPPEQLQAVIDTATRLLADYDVTKKCMALVPLDSKNVQLAKRYLACLMVDGKSQKTIYQYGRHIARFSETLGKDFEKIGAFDIRFYLATLKEKGLSNRSIDNARAALSAFFQWMAAEDIIQKSPTASIKPVKYIKEVRKPFSDVEIDAIRSACGTQKERALIEILLSSGIRVSELTDMDAEDIDLVSMTVHVKHGKGGKERITYINPVAAKHLKLYLQERNEDAGALFYNNRHKRLEPGGVRYIINQIANKAGVKDCHPHRFRRTFATNLALRGMDIQEIQRLLGHSNIATTLEYVAINDEKVKASYRKFA